jgi:hypothetical protein
MSGTIITVLDRAAFSFNLPASTTQDVQFGNTFKPFDTRDWKSAILKVVLHAKSFASNTATAKVKAHNVHLDPQNPTTAYGTSTNPAEATIANADSAPLLYLVAFDLVGDQVACDLTFTQGTATGVCTMTISLYLIGRDV